MADAPRKLSIFDLQAKVARGEKIFQVTAVDFPTAQLVDRAGIDCILIGDSVGMTSLGYSSTVPVTMDEMLHHARAVARAAKSAINLNSWMTSQRSTQSLARRQSALTS